MTLRPVPLVLGLVMMLVVPYAAGYDGCEPTTSDPEVTAQSSSGRFYVDNDPCQPHCRASIWIYEESNAIDGLQREDEVKDDTCGGRINGDTIIDRYE